MTPLDLLKIHEEQWVQISTLINSNIKSYINLSHSDDANWIQLYYGKSRKSDPPSIKEDKKEEEVSAEELVRIEV